MHKQQIVRITYIDITPSGMSSGPSLSSSTPQDCSSSSPAPVKKNKKIPFNKHGNLAKQNQGNGSNDNQRANTDENSNENHVIDNKKRRKCRLCQEPHMNLVFCKKLSSFIPIGGNV